MLLHNGLKRGLITSRNFSSHHLLLRRTIHYDGRNRLSNFWTPTQNLSPNTKSDPQPSSRLEDGHDLLLRAGYLRQAHSGIFHLLPLGLRIQNKLEALIDKHMQSLGASKVSLSSLSSEDLWERSGRLEGRGSEFFRLEDRKDAKYLLAPTHEEEITTIVANAVHSYKDLPLRLYQVTRKYRDEARPRQGLLRGREFVMKDLYTFDATEAEARATYEEVRKAYSAFLDELKLPYLVANADSGNMGGKLSHEYHFISENGEDTIIGCRNCDFSMNEELYVGRLPPASSSPTSTTPPPPSGPPKTWTGISKDRKTLIHALYPTHAGPFNIHAIKALFPQLDSSIENPAAAYRQALATSPAPEKSSFTQLFYADPRLPSHTTTIVTAHPSAPRTPINITPSVPLLNGSPIHFTKALAGEPCPSCHAAKSLHMDRAIEIGHTFHLSTRYSAPLHANALSAQNKPEPIIMGCHGIGVSRLIGAIASQLADRQGLNWPLAIAPFGVVIVPTKSAEGGGQVEALYDELAASSGLDVVIEDRKAHGVGWKFADADLIGYPFIVVMGKAWREGRVEVQCRRLGVKEVVPVGEVAERIRGWCERL